MSLRSKKKVLKLEFTRNGVSETLRIYRAIRKNVGERSRLSRNRR